MKMMKDIRRILLFLICITVMLTGMYAPNMDIDSYLSSSNVEKAIAPVNRHVKNIDATADKLGTVTDEVKIGFSPETTSTLLLRIHSYLFSTAVLPIIPLILWTLLIVLLRKEFVDRMFLILFIHNSDGEKGDSASI